MMQIAHHLPAWLLACLPVSLARHCASKSASTTTTSSGSIRQLLVDISVIHQSDAQTGIQRVVRSLLSQLLQAPPAGYKICPIFATRKHSYHYVAPCFVDHSAQPTEVTQKAVQGTVHAQKGDLFLGLDLATYLLPHHRSQILGWKRNGVEVHVVVYDLLPLLHPEWFNPKTIRNFKRWIKWVAVYSDTAVCISEIVKRELNTWMSVSFGLPPTALPSSTIALGADIGANIPTNKLPNDAKHLLNCMRHTPAVLMVGTLEPRKGYDEALAAFEHLWQKQSDMPLPILVIVGRPGWKTKALQEKLRMHPQAGKRLFWLEDVNDEYLGQLYAACSGVLVASRAEGFGLPIIEAALHGKPILARDLPVFRELCVPNISYFHESMPKALTHALSKWLVKLVKGNSSARIEKPITTSPPLHRWETAASDLLLNLGLLSKRK